MKFLVDAMLGNLCRILRLLGFDAKYVKYNNRKEILKELLSENRILLTRAHNFTKKENIIVINSEKLDEQIEELDKLLKIKEKAKPFTRCIVCNNELEMVDKSKVKLKVPFFVYQNFNEFAYCPLCNKYYWKGSHYKNMVKKIKELKCLQEL